MTSLGIDVDAKKNQTVLGKEGDVSTSTSQAAVLVIPTNEEQAIAKDTYAIVSGATD